MTQAPPLTWRQAQKVRAIEAALEAAAKRAVDHPAEPFTSEELQAEARAVLCAINDYDVASWGEDR